MALGPWLTRWPGQWLLEFECGEYAQALPDLFGFHLLQVGVLGDVDLTASSRIRHRVVASTRLNAIAACHLVSEPDSLPIAGHSVDVLLLPHSLEYCADPQQVLREAERVLVSGGHVLISGFSLWSAISVFRWVSRNSAPSLVQARYLAPYRVRDWLKLLGFDVLERANGWGTEPASPLPWSWSGWRPASLARRLLPWLCGSYFIVARKSEGGVIPLVGRRARMKGLLPGAIVQPSPRAGSLPNRTTPDGPCVGRVLRGP